MSSNTSPKLKFFLVLEQSQTWSSARDLRQHKCRPMLKLTKWINVAIPCGPYLPHRAFVYFFHLILGSWMVECFVPCLSYLASFWNQSRENMILWFLNIRHSGTPFMVPHLQLNKCSFSSYPLKPKYVELMGKEKGYNSSHVYCQAKRWSKKS
jgi:hypothetical protein